VEYLGILELLDPRDRQETPDHLGRLVQLATLEIKVHLEVLVQLVLLDRQDLKEVLDHKD
jgi:hypothetical protein